MIQIPTMPAQLAPAQLQQATQPRYEITEQDKQRVQRISDAWKAYNGELNKPLRKMDDQPDDNVMSNRCAQIADQGAAFLFGKEVEISVEESASPEAQKLLDLTWGRKEARIPLLQKLAMNGAMAGTAFLRIVPEPNGTYRLVVVDPATVYVQTAPQDCETVLLYCIQYCTHQKIDGKVQPVYYREEIARVDPDGDGDDGDPFADVDANWFIGHWSRVGERGPWTSAGAPIVWPYSFPPLFSCQNLPRPNDFWGLPDITPDIIGMNQSLNLVQSCVNRVLKLYGSPIIYATGTGQQVIDIRPGKILGLPLSESKVVAVPITSDVASALAFADNLRSDIDEQSAVPGIATARISSLPRGNLSGIAIELLFMPIVKKTDKKQCLYGDLLINTSKALFVLNGIGQDLDVTLAWQSAVPRDGVQEAQAAVLLKQIGVSSATLQREMGYDPDEELALSQNEGVQKAAQATPQAPLQGNTPMNGGQQ